MLELIALGSDPEAGREIAASLGGVAYGASDGTPPEAPFRSLIRVVTDDLDALDPASDLGLYVTFGRVMRREQVDRKAGQPTRGVVAVFGLHRNPSLSHREADAHWRDVHQPLALVHHPGMCDYHQASIVDVVRGPAYDGFAFCKFASHEDLRDRFFDDDHGRAVILADIKKFADLARSPRAVHTDHWEFSAVST